MLHHTVEDDTVSMLLRTEATPMDYKFARIAIELSRSACRAGDEPFGAVVAHKDGTILDQAENMARRDGNRLHHAEVVAILDAVNAGRAAELKSANLRQLREQAVARLRRENPQLVNSLRITDYLLYEIIGGLITTDFTRYVDAARIYGYITISILLAAFAYYSKFALDRGYVGRLVFTAVVISVYFFGRELVKMQYRNRAIRLYVTYLTAPAAAA